MKSRLSIQNGFSLLELLVVLMLISVVGTIAIRSTVDIGYSARYEQTRDRLESIRTAIIGNPKRTINGQPDISGFVADMGRLPVNLRELVDQNYCTVDRTIDETTSGAAAADCNAITADSWVNQTGYTAGTSDTLSFGWNGPYLRISSGVTDPDTYTDGWGRESQNISDFDFGWLYSITGNDLIIKSLGKNQIVGGMGFDEDLKAAVLEEEWKKNIEAGITANISASYSPAVPVPCDASVIEESAVCTAANWSGGSCSGSETNKTDCLNNSGTWTDCSASLPTSKAFCQTNGGIWSFNSENICLKVTYRAINATTGATEINSGFSNNSVPITEDGLSKLITFGFNAGSKLPVGSALIGVYSSDTANCNAAEAVATYPATCVDTFSSATFTQANCVANSGKWKVIGGVNHCYGMKSFECTGTTAPELGGELKLKPDIKIPIIPGDQLISINW